MKNIDILFVDDDHQILNLVNEFLSRKGYQISVADDGKKALDLVHERDFDIVFTDLNMPVLNGLDLLEAIKAHRSETEVIIVTGFGTINSAIKALKLGSYDYLQKPINLDRLSILIDRISDKKRLERENVILKERLKQRHQYTELVGVSPKMQKVYEIIDKISSTSPPVLIQGESGTGKEVVAKVIHSVSDRKNKPFIAVNCGAIVEGLLESELFGHVKGAFTGALKSRAGLFRAADQGTLFLDEIAEVNPTVQVKLLRVLQEKKIRPVGATREHDVDVRIIAATNRNLDEAVADGHLREDLYYRLNVVSIVVPPLREKKEDISLLVNHFIKKFSFETGSDVSGITPEATDILLNYHWPGNVRQLENVIHRAFALGAEDVIDINDIPAEILNTHQKQTPTESSFNLAENELRLIKKALQKTGGKKSEAAKLLGVNVTTVYRKMAKYRIDEGTLSGS